MATVIKEISLPHGTIPTQMFGNVNLQNAMMYVNENFAEVKSGVNDAVAAANEALDAKADADHDHDEDYAALEHTHAQSEIVGLSSALDGKAELNHEHSQYLTSLPAHYHATSEVQGLDNLLQAKAEKVHTHTIADVENLTTELGVKASTSYVDQQVNSVSTSIKPIAKYEVEDHAADKGDSSTLSADVPKDVIEKPDSETIAAKNARVGTSTDYARADHVHVFDFEMPEVPSVGTLTNDHILKATITTESGKTVKKIDDSGVYSPAALALSASDSVMVYQSGTQITSGNLVKADSSAYKVVDSEIKASDVSATVGLFDKENETPKTIKKTALPEYTASKWMKTDASGNIGTTSESPVALPGTTGILATEDGSTCITKSIGRAEGNVCPGVHTHAADDGTLTGFGTAAEYDADEFAPSSTVSFPGFGTVAGKAAEGNHTHTHSGISDWSTATSSFLTDDDIDSAVQAHSDKLDNLDSKLNSDGTLPSSAVSDANCTSGGDCLAYFKSDKTLGHLSCATNTATVSNTNAVTADFNYDTSGITKSATLNYKAAGASAAPTTQKVIGFAANTATASLVDAATFASGTTIEGDKFVKTTSSGTLVEDDFAGLEDTASNIQDVGTTKSLGNSTKAAPSNHVHALPTMNGWTGDQTLTDMITFVYHSQGGYYTMNFYAPIFDKYGRYKGLSSTATKSIDFYAA